MFDRLALHLFKQFVVFGALSVTIGSGAVYRMTENRPGPKVAIKIANSRTLWRVVMKPDLVIGEAYMDGLLRIKNDDLESFVELLMLNSRHWAGHWAGRLSLFLAHRLAFLSYWNKPRAARRNVAHHYDLTDQLFDSFLDPRRQYSCAYFADPGMSLEDAQAAKKAHIAGKLLLRPGMRVLDIGCGLGTESKLLARDDRTVIGLDYDLGTAGLAQAAIDGVVCGDARRLPFRTNSLDWVSSSHIIEHFTDPERHVAEIARVLRPGGRLVVLTPNAPADFENPFHVHLFSLDMFGELLNKYFDTAEVSGLTGNVETMKTFEQRRRAGRRLLALDPFGLRHRLPTRALTGLHSIGRRVVYPLLRSADESITADDFEVINRSESIDDSTLVLVGTATAA